MTGKKKFPLPTWLGCLLLVALTFLGSLRYWLPITEDSGESYTLRLERAFVSNNTLWLDFGKSDHFRFPYAEADSPLLKASAVGKEYHITAEYHATRRNRSDYYEIYALTGADGTEYLTISQAEAQRLGMLVDVSHISDEGFWDIMDITNAPVIATHSNSRSVWGESRNLTDDMFRAIVKTGGLAGFNMCAEFIGEAPTLDTACDHILRFMELDPTGKHIALGGDLDGIDHMPEGFTGVQDYTKFADRLLQRGLDEHTVMDIFWNNAFGVMKKCCM